MNRSPTSPNDPVNTDILMVAEDRVIGFRRLPFHAIAEQCGHPVPQVIERLKAMMEAGVVRRVRQTLLATKLAQGALVAWRVPEERLEAAFDWMQAEIWRWISTLMVITDLMRPRPEQYGHGSWTDSRRLSLRRWRVISIRPMGVIWSTWVLALSRFRRSFKAL